MFDVNHISSRDANGKALVSYSIISVELKLQRERAHYVAFLSVKQKLEQGGAVFADT
jgi:hypothetical protein